MPDIIDTTNLPWQIKTAIKYISDYGTESSAALAKQKEIAERSYKIQQYNTYHYYLASTEIKFKRKGDYRIERTNPGSIYQDYIVLESIESLQEWRNKEAAILEANNVIAANNAKAADRLISLIEGLGIKTKHPDPKSRASTWKKPSVTKNWVSELRAEFQLADKQGDVVGYWDKLIERVKKQNEQEAEAKKKLDAETAAQEKQVKLQAMILGLVKKYDLDVSKGLPGKEEIIDVLLGKDKYLRFAHFLQLNRGDWSDGYDYANTGLNGFKVESITDRAIYDEISGYISSSDGDCDGRVFRDCEFNYSVIFGMANQELYKDYIGLSNL